MRPNPVRLWIVVAALCGVALLAGCSAKKTLVPNLAPQTTLFVQGPVDTVNHVVHLFWFGTDVDGNIAGFEVRFFNPAAPADTQWTFTTKSDSIFTVLTPTGLTAPRFEVRAVDNAGLRDPSPATEDFTFSNTPPIVTFTAPRFGPRDTTFASATITWSASDPDGDASKMQFRLWFNGNEATPRIVTGTSLTIPSSDFLEAGQFHSGVRTLNIQATDDGGLAGPVDHMSWFVYAPVESNDPRLLIIDDAPGPASVPVDSVYTNAAVRNLPPNTFRILKLETNQPFRSQLDLEQTLKLFKSVVWYRGTQNNLSTLLLAYPDALAHYLDAGGKLYLEGLNMVSGQLALGSLPEHFVNDYLDSDRLILSQGASNPADSTVSWSISSQVNGSPVILRSSLFADSLKQTQQYAGLRGFAIRDTNEVVLWARSGNLAAPHAFDIPIAVTVPQANGGRFMLVTTPLRGANGFFTLPGFMVKVLQSFGIVGP